jgi:hypothetical protein
MYVTSGLVAEYLFHAEGTNHPSHASSSLGSLPRPPGPKVGSRWDASRRHQISWTNAVLARCSLSVPTSWRHRNEPLVPGISHKRPSLSWSKGGVLHYIFDVFSVMLGHVVCSSLLLSVVGQDGKGITASLGFSRCCQCLGVLLWPDSCREWNQLLCCS